MGTFGLLLVLAAAPPSAADCGGEAVTVSTASIAPAALRGAVGVLTLSLRGPAPSTIDGYVDAALTGPRSVPLSAWVPVTRAPGCFKTHTFDGSRFIVTARSGEWVRVVPDSTQEEGLWLDLKMLARDFSTHYAAWESVRPGFGVNPELLRGPPAAYAGPDRKARRLAWPPGIGNYRVLEQRGDFFELGYWPGPEGKIVSAGWVRLRDAQGFLQLWPWYYDDC